MPHRITHIANMFGTMLDLGVFGTALGVIFGLSPSEAGAFMAGLGALVVGLGRAAKFFGEAREANARARVHETYSDPAVFRKLERLKCWNAPDCPSRELFAPENYEEENHD
jgi:hypothetical protein